jgi:hypothetical protein
MGDHSGAYEFARKELHQENQKALVGLATRPNQSHTRAKPEPTRPDQTKKMTRAPENHFVSNQRWPIIYFPF